MVANTVLLLFVVLAAGFIAWAIRRLFLALSRRVTPQPPVTGFGTAEAAGGAAEAGGAARETASQEVDAPSSPSSFFSRVSEGLKASAHERAEMRRRIEEKRAAGEDPVEVLTKEVKEAGDPQRASEAIAGAVEAGFSTQEVARALSAAAYDLDGIDEVLAEHFNLDFGERFEVLASVAPGASASEKAEQALDAIDEYETADAVEPLLKQGLSPAEAAALVYKKTDDRLGAILAEMPASVAITPEIIAESAKLAGADLSDEEECGSLSGDASLDDEIIYRAMRLAGVSTEAAADCLEKDSDCDADDFAAALAKAGYPTAEILEALWSMHSLSAGDVVAAASEAGIDESAIIGFLVAKDADPEELDEELNDLEFDFRTKIRILNALLSSPRLEDVKDWT